MEASAQMLSLDTTCPVALPAKGNSDPIWPFDNLHQPSTKQRYLESLFLPEILSPLHLLADDLSSSPGEISLLLLSLSEIEHRHRKLVAPLLNTLTAVHANKEVKLAKLEEAKLASGLEEDEVQVVISALGLRLGCRAVVEGDGLVNPRKLIEELERRETLIQIILLLVYAPHAPPPVKKRKRDRQEPVVSPRDQPKEAIELLFDRLSVWQAVAELGMTSGVGEMLDEFWKGVMLKQLTAQPEICRSFHFKVFGKPYDEPSTKKPRKPKVTRARPSSVIIPEAQPMRRSVSHTSDKERPRSRSASIDPAVTKKPLMRAPSGKDLFKGREVGLMRRSASAILRKQKSEMLAPPAPVAKTGLLGRKLSDKAKPVEDFSNTLVFATPAKPKQVPGRYIPPTPIQEEVSPWYRGWVGETPVSRVVETPVSRVADTPMSKMDWDSEDPLGDLMVMTDEEEETQDMVPDTPAR